MNMIIEKFSFVTRYVVAVFLAAAACFSWAEDVITLPGGCTATWSEESQGWFINCTIQGGVTGFIPGSQLGGNGCTNCVQMKPAECAAIKSQIISMVEEVTTQHHIIDQSARKIKDDCDRTLELLYAIEDEGDYFENFPTSADVPGYKSGGSQVSAQQYLNDTANGSYMSDQIKGATSGNVNQFNMQRHSVNSIYNYYNEGIKPNLTTIIHDVEDISLEASAQKEALDTLYSYADAIRDIAYTMNCEVCSNGSGSGSSDPSNPSSGGCPCAELIQKVVNAAESTLEEVKKISEKVEDWDEYIKYIKKILDNVKELNQALSPMGTNYNYAVQYKNLDGITFQMKTLDKLLNQNKVQGFDFGEFGKLSWFSRVEYLLLSISGVYSRTNMTGVTSEALDGYYENINDRKTTLQAGVDGVTSGFSSLATSYTSLCNSLKSSIGTGSGNKSFNLFPSWFGGRGLLVTFPSAVISTARAVTSLFWSVLFACVLYEILLNGWLVFFDFIKFFVSSTSTMFS